MTPVSRRSAAMATLLGHGTTVTITVVQAFVLVPLCLSSLGVSTYGAWLGASELLIWIQLLDLGLPSLLAQRVGAASGRGDRSDAARWSATGLLLLLVVAAVMLAVGVGLASFVQVWVGVPADDAKVFRASFQVAVVASALILWFNGLLGLARGIQQPTIVNLAQVAGVTANLVVSLVLLLAGWGLWALAAGLAVRAVISVAGGLVFLARLPGQYQWVSWPSAAVAREIASLAPAMAGASVGSLLANNSEVFLVAAILGPVPAAVYALTRRAVDGLRNLLDVFVTAVQGGFAHLMAADERGRARAIAKEILWLRLAAACGLGATVLAVNEGFVTLLFGRAHYGGLWLTSAFVLQLVVGGHALLYNTLLRAAGQIREGSWLLLAEAAARLGVMASALAFASLAGAPWAAVVVSAAAWWLTRRRLNGVLPRDEVGGVLTWATRLAPVLVAGLGLAIAVWAPPLTWPAVGATAAGVTLAGGALLFLVRPAGAGGGTMRLPGAGLGGT